METNPNFKNFENFRIFEISQNVPYSNPTLDQIRIANGDSW